MKNVMKNITMGVASVVMIANSSTVMANNEKKKEASRPNASLEVISRDENQATFQLNVANTNKERLVISIKDEYGNVLYRKLNNSELHTVKFQLDANELQDGVLRVEVTGTNVAPTVFQIKNYTHIVEKLEIEKGK
ncbi:MAG: hypothetical protein EAZ16_00425 [Sphingobacteriales bacterium]|jgi:flagellar hook assembly protein FlgD|nr:MAG: hypothetical protein EAZ16_00425 [Sphingobacteriales bacterium]